MAKAAIQSIAPTEGVCVWGGGGVAQMIILHIISPASHCAYIPGVNDKYKIQKM